MSEIAVLIPCYNEAKTIAKVIAEYKAALPQAKIVVYDNNSDDNTDDVARAAGAEVRYEYRQGKGNVVRSMFRDIDADCYLLVDGDDTYPADKAKELVELVLCKGADMVIGDRLSSTYFSENKRLFHNSGNRVVRYLINLIFQSDLHDIMTGSRAFSRRFVKTFPVVSKGFEIETEMTIHALDKNLLVKEIPVPYRDRPDGSVSKLNTVRDGARVIGTIGRLFREYKPFSFFSIFAVLLIVFAAVLFVPVFVEYLKTGRVLRFPTLFVSGFACIAGLLLWICGLILEVIAQKHKQLYELMTTLILKNEKPK